MAGLRIEGNISGNIAEVDANNNLNVVTPIIETQAGFVTLSSEVDAGSITGVRVVKALEATEDYRLRVGVDTLLFSETFSSTTLNTSVWTAPVNGAMTVVITGGWCVLNSSASTANPTDSRLQTWRYFPIFGTCGTYYEMVCSITQLPQIYNTTEWGAGIAAGTSAPTDGAFFRIASDQTFKCVLSYGGSETYSGPLSFANLIGVNKSRHFVVTITDTVIDYWIDDIKVATLPKPVTNPYTVASSSLPVFVRTYNTIGSPVLAQQIKVGQITVSLADSLTTKPWSHIMAGAGAMAYQGTTGAAVGQTAQLVISTNPGAAAPTATTAGLGAGLGGVFLANITGLAVTTDYIISSYLNPLGTATAPGRTLYITGVKFDAVNMGAVNITTPLTWLVGIHAGSTNVNPVTAESATAKASRRIPIGVQTVAVNAAIGVPGTPNISADFSQSPIIIQQGEYVQTFIRFITYTSTTSQALWCYVTFIGYWE